MDVQGARHEETPAPRRLVRGALGGAALVAALIFAFHSLQGSADPPAPGRLVMQIRSSAFRAFEQIPTRFTCEGDDVSPPLSWTDVPREAVSLALVVDDPDAPNPAAPRMTWVHWVLCDLPVTASGLAEAVKQLPAGTVEGVNDWHRTGYGGPCPPVGRHRYFFKLYALDTKLELTKPTKAAVEAAMNGHVLAQAELVGTYEKKAAR